MNRYGCTFSSLTIRATHIEVTKDLSTDAFIKIIRRFIARKSNLICIYSDNGAKFVAAERFSKKSLEAWNQYQIYGQIL